MKKLIVFLMIAMLVLSGCAAPQQEESAAAGEYIEGEQKEDVEIDLPEKVENSTVGNTAPKDEPADNDEPKDDKTPTEEPKDEPTDDPGEEEPTEEPGEEDPTVEYDEANRLKIVSYNIRYTDDPDGNSIDERAPRLKAVLDQYDPDLVGMQEATPRWIDHIYEDYGDEYEIRYKYRAKNSQESTPLMFKKDKFELLDEGYFWLSETPDSESIAWGADHYRICNWVKLKLKSTGKELLFFNTHFDGTEEFHVNAGNLVIQKAKTLGGFNKCAVFLTGDFNMLPWKAGYSNLVVGGEFSDVNEDLGRDDSITTDGYNTAGSGRIIDFVFYSPNKAVPLKYQVLNEKVNGGYVSDHRGLYTEVAVK